MTVAFSKLPIGGGDITLKSVYELLLGCAAVMLCQLAMGRAPRGAIEVGKGCDFFPDEVYGPVLDCVHRLETKRAEYPRIVVGPKLIRCLDACEDNLDTSRAAEFCRKIVPMCRELVDLDENGFPFVDFLGEAHRKHVSKLAPEAILYARKGFNFVLAERDRFATENTELGAKLASRYDRLSRYFESRIANWAS